MNAFGYSLVRTADYKELMTAYSRVVELKEGYRRICTDLRTELAKRNCEESNAKLDLLRQRIGELYAAFHSMEFPIDQVIVQLDMLAEEAKNG